MCYIILLFPLTHLFRGTLQTQVFPAVDVVWCFLNLQKRLVMEKAAGCVCYYLLMAKVGLARLQLSAEKNRALHFATTTNVVLRGLNFQYLLTLVFSR